MIAAMDQAKAPERKAPLPKIRRYAGEVVYKAYSARFHLADWHRTIDKKLQTPDDLYQLLNHDQTNRWMLILELTIVVLFVIDLVILVLGIKWR